VLKDLGAAYVAARSSLASMLGFKEIIKHGLEDKFMHRVHITSTCMGAVKLVMPISCLKPKHVGEFPCLTIPYPNPVMTWGETGLGWD